ncbi:UPF0378 protein KIAA0100 [Strongyloides ratti]|uniref:UPF0378 protein KIAA0100 n=1 Tax=Strongyloides ratti TaxID=34506 RepID=A0A090LAK9_STRRB|nr:UPF0378 protein KIAA0100 [Strongyloides ratti]CEF66821.1 UPF0378 protein KIAA0100 [Strongyloides ratti]
MFFTITIAISFAFFIFIYMYLRWIVSKILARTFSCYQVKLGKCGLLYISHLKLIYIDGLSVEIDNLRIGSSLISTSYKKPISFVVDDLRIEGTPNVTLKSLNLLRGKKDGNNENSSLKRFFQYVQYFGIFIKTANFVFLDIVPQCLLHLTFEQLYIETYLERDGLQVDCTSKLIQQKLLLRNQIAGATSLMELSLASSLSFDFAPDYEKMKNVSMSLDNPSIYFSEALVEYVKVNMPEQSPVNEDNDIQKVEKNVPFIKMNIDNLIVEYKTSMERTLMLNLKKITSEIDWKHLKLAIDFKDFCIKEHTGVSHFKCGSFCVLSSSKPTNSSNEAQWIEVVVFNPLLILDQNDLMWWIDYGKKLDLQNIFCANGDESMYGFNDEFTCDGVRISPLEKKSKNLIYLNFEVNTMSILLRNSTKGNVDLIFGIELITFVGDSKFKCIELGIESLWSHRCLSKTFDLTQFQNMRFNPIHHVWGTIIALGAGLGQFKKINGQKILQFQLEDLQLEWEKTVVEELATFIKNLIESFKDKKTDLDRSDSWSAVGSDDASESYGIKPFILQFSLKNLAIFFNAKQSAFLAVNVDSFRCDYKNLPQKNLDLKIESIRLGVSELKTSNIIIDWYKYEEISIDICGMCDSLEIHYISGKQRDLFIKANSSFNITWSPFLYVVFYEVYSLCRKLFNENFVNEQKMESIPLTPLTINILSLKMVEICYKLPREHIMQWRVPSIYFQKRHDEMSISSPEFNIIMDSHPIFHFEHPLIQMILNEPEMFAIRQGMESLHTKTNKTWLWSAELASAIFPYEYNFASAYEEVINSIKWMKKVHNHVPKPFLESSPLPSDVKISIKKFNFQMNDDPFEIRLQANYELMVDEAYESERRRRVMEEKISEGGKQFDGEIGQNLIEELYTNLRRKNCQIYIDRCKKMDVLRNQLFYWTITDLCIRAFADISLHGKDNVIKLMRKFNPETNAPLEDMKFSTMWAREIEMDFNEWNMNFRDYPLEYCVIKDAHFFGRFAAAENCPGGRSIRNTYITLPEPWGIYELERNMCPLKFYYDLFADVNYCNITYGPCWEPCLSMISLCFNNINPPSRDPSPNMPFWDKIRLLHHGRFSMLCKKYIARMLASTDPYNSTEFIEIVWNDFEFDWTTGQFRIKSDVEAFVRTASKYDDSRILNLPGFKFEVQLRFICTANAFDHHSVTPCAPNKLPDCSTNHEHDSYRAFRSHHINAVIHFDVKNDQDSPERNIPQILLYANTFKWFDFMKNTLTTVNKPIKRGQLFSNGKLNRKFQLSRHFKDVHLRISLPRVMISYWMSCSSNYGFRMITNSLHLTADLQLLHLKNKDNENMIKRQRITWKLNHMSASLERAHIHLYGDSSKPESVNEMNDSDDSFFLGMSRINYIRENIYEGTPNLSRRNIKDPHHLQYANHRLTIQDVRASWTMENRDTCFVIADGVQKAHILRKVLSTDALKNWMFNSSSKLESPKESDKSTHKKFIKEEKNRKNNISRMKSSSFESRDNEATEMLWKLVDEAETKFVAWHENTVDPPSNSLYGVALCTKDDIFMHNWQIDLLNCQAVLKGHETDGFIIMTASRAAINENIHTPVWRDNQLLIKTSWSAVFSGMQYFAPVMMGKDKNSLNKKQFSWLRRDVIEEKPGSDQNINDKINDYSGTGEAVGGVVSDGSTVTNSNGLQLQRVASRCSCQMLFVSFTDLINIEDNAILPSIPPPPTPEELSNQLFLGDKKENVDCFTLKHNMLEVSTNSEQYQMILDIINNLVLFVDPFKKKAESKRKLLWFKYSQMKSEEIRQKISELQAELREVVTLIRSYDRQLYYLIKDFEITENKKELDEIEKKIKNEIEENKEKQIMLIDELALTISCFREKEVEQKTLDKKENKKKLPIDEDNAITIAKRFEVCFESCVWKLTETDGQISLTELQIRNFLYTRTVKTDNSGEHLLEIGGVKVLDLLPNAKFKETLTRIRRNGDDKDNERIPSIRVICRDRPAVGGIAIKEHFEVNVSPMQAQISNKFYKQMMGFFFPGKSIETTEQQTSESSEVNLSTHKNSIVTPVPPGNRSSMSFANKFKGTINGSFRRQSVDPNKDQQTNDKIDKMKARADKNNMFVHIKISEVPFIVSYKGTKEKNISDINKYHFLFPLCEYHDKNWTWLDLAMAIKNRCRIMISKQFVKQKFLRTKNIGFSLGSLPNELNEDEKKLMVLGNATVSEKEKKKKNSRQNADINFQ